MRHLVLEYYQEKKWRERTSFSLIICISLPIIVFVLDILDTTIHKEIEKDDGNPNTIESGN